MKIMKKLIASIAVMSTAVAVAVDDQVISWGVENPTLSGGESVEFDYATIQVKNNDGTMFYLYDQHDDPTNYMLWLLEGMDYTDGWFGFFDASKVDSFFVQLYLYDRDAGARPNPSTDKVVAWNTYSASLNKDKFGVINSADRLQTLWVSQVIPEPTSGLLLLFGVAGLALKRRRQAV